MVIEEMNQKNKIKKNLKKKLYPLLFTSKKFYSSMKITKMDETFLGEKWIWNEILRGFCGGHFVEGF